MSDSLHAGDLRGSANRGKIVASVALLTFLYAMMVLPAAIYNPMASFDEAWYASVGRNVLHSGDWLTFYYNGEPFWEKPPLFLWTTAVSFKLFGVSDFASRIFTMGCGLACLLAVFGFVRREVNVAVALLTGLVLLGAQDFVRFSAKGQMDIPVTLFLTLQLISFWRARGRPNAFWMSGLWMGLAIATKNQVGVLGVIIEVAYMIVAWDLAPLRQWRWYARFGIVAAIGLPWYLHQYVVHGAAFLDWFYYKNYSFADDFNDHLFYTRYLVERHNVLVVMMLFGAGWAVYRRVTANEKLPMLMACWALVIPGMFSYFGAPHYWYIVPMYPGVAILAGLAINGLPVWERWPRPVMGVLGCWAVIFQASFYLPLPKQEALWAAKGLVPTIQGEVPQEETIFLLMESDGRNKKAIHIPAAHYYFDHVSREVRDPGRVEDTVGSKGPFFAVGRIDVVEETYRSKLPAHRMELVKQQGDSGLYRFVPTQLASEPSNMSNVK
ncbi:Undecaprenyl phosphate-alpha-4-amino-4-deoxy-L-arabinose arabinosyl transferase [Planctomycetes bacterium Pan216]|uniref:Undecaprenyl phosphate-alpha-4-amino-4-deoxy-L-arabinose arabinosyl transferase n=1 Tax=Kolteria novifilia TaxID=2527975 RepID=A0A518B1V8_9BACT|nr:Undecaprenyl phosphate-alpha-4-amino-4-deoxy-L-arabinose arabinosyl transferase [Planctomycetes bacterium Pan216]